MTKKKEETVRKEREKERKKERKKWNINETWKF